MRRSDDRDDQLVPQFFTEHIRLFGLFIIQYKMLEASISILDSIVVSIPACHAGDRGSILRREGFFQEFFFF